MRYRNRNYIRSSNLFFILIIATSGSVLLTLYFDASSFAKTGACQSIETGLKPGLPDLPPDPGEFQTGDEALFNFTGDTVLVLSQTTSLPGSEQEVRVLHKTKVILKRWICQKTGW